MIACKFTYNTVQSEQGHSTIQLKKDQEDRMALILGRKCLHEYGQKILKLEIGKHSNQLPPFVIQDKISSNIAKSIKDEIQSMAQEKLRNLESEISSIIEEEEKSLDWSTHHDIIDAMHDDMKSIGKEGHHPSTPDTDQSSANSDDHERNMTQNALPLHVNIVKENESTLKSNNYDKDETSAISNVIRATSNLESFQCIIDNERAKDVNKLSIEEKMTLDKVSAFEINGMEEDDMILSVVDGRLPDPVETKSMTNGLMNKLKKLTLRGQGQSEKYEEEKEKLTVEEKTVISHATISSIRIKDTEGFKLKFNDDGGIDEPRVDTQQIDKPILDINGIRLGNDISPEYEKAVKVGLNFFFFLFVQIFRNPCTSNGKVSAPLEIVYRLWVAVLRSELEIEGVQSDFIFEAFHHLTKVREDDEVEGADKVSIILCQLLQDHGLITSQCIEERCKDVNSKSHFSYQLISIKKGSHQYSESNPKTSKWHSIIVRCNETLNTRSSQNETMSNNISSSDALSLLYAAKMLPHHMFQAGSHKDAVGLLLDKNFIVHRFETCGYLAGTKRHLDDATFIINNMEKTDSRNVDGSHEFDFGESALEAINDLVLELLEEKKKEVDVQMKSVTSENQVDDATLQSAHEIGCSLHLLGVSLGKVKSYQKEIDVYSEALRLKYASKCSEISIAETLLAMSVSHRNLGDLWDALSRCEELLTIEIKINGNSHINTAKVLHHQGIVLTELSDFDNALICFQKSLRILTALGASSDEVIVKTLCWIGKVQREKGNLSDALDSFDSARNLVTGEESLTLAEIFQVSDYNFDSHSIVNNYLTQPFHSIF